MMLPVGYQIQYPSFAWHQGRIFVQFDILDLLSEPEHGPVPSGCVRRGHVWGTELPGGRHLPRSRATLRIQEHRPHFIPYRELGADLGWVQAYMHRAHADCHSHSHSLQNK